MDYSVYSIYYHRTLKNPLYPTKIFIGTLVCNVFTSSTIFVSASTSAAYVNLSNSSFNSVLRASFSVCDCDANSLAFNVTESPGSGIDPNLDQIPKHLWEW